MEFSSVETASRFLASTLHEIRTPIQTIISTAELLSETDLNDEQREYTRQIKFSAGTIVQLANDILDFTKIREKNFKLESTEFNVCELVEQVVDSVSIEAFNKGVEIITDIDYSLPDLVVGDPIRIQQIVLNLIKNAVKFTPSGYVKVSVGERKGYLCFQVKDSGIGIAPDKRELIFSDYYQADSSISRRFGGTGLGLSICKNLVGIMRGKIGVAENPGGGSIFWFVIPYKKAEPVQDTARRLPEDLLRTVRFIIVDDNRLAAKSLYRKLAGLGIQNIDSALDGTAAIRLMKQANAGGAPYTAAFIDMQMPQKDGWRIGFEINHTDAIAGTKLYLVVPEGQMHGDAKMKMLKLFSGYIYKPVKRHVLEKLLYECLEQRLPEAPADDIAPPAPAGKPRDARRLKVLVAEDHPMNRHLMEVFLERLGAEHFSAENGQEAVDAIKERPDIDIVFMDMQMPIKSGIDATVELRNIGYKGTIIACTANNDPADFRNYTQLGIDDFLIKPYKRDSLAGVLDKWQGIISSPGGKEQEYISKISAANPDLWDFDDFMETNCNITDSARTSLNLYRNQTRQILADVQEALKRQLVDWHSLQIQGHTLKGSSGLVGSKKLSSNGADMENAAKAQDIISYEIGRINFALNFTEFERISDRWLTSL